MNNIKEYNNKTFEDIKHTSENGEEFWYARELQQILGYKEWRYFSAVIEKLKLLAQQVKIILISILVFTPKS